MNITHHGAHHSVTGSCHELHLGKSSLLVDCGQYQGADVTEETTSVGFSIRSIEALIVTHAHIDHVGRIPWLIAAGFSGPIYCTPATAELLPLLLEDGLRIQLGLSVSQIRRILQLVSRQVVAIEYGQWFRVKLERTNSFCYLRFSHAGHILGSAIVEIKLANGEVVVFSGDLGPSNTPLLPDPISPPRADYLVLESTYGDKQHEAVEERASRLRMIIQRSLVDGGTIIIPAFSIGRTQELLFDIEQLIHQSGIESRLPIILDSPMAVDVTRAYRKFKKLWGKEAKRRLDMNRHPLAFKQCITIGDYREHKALVNRLAQSGEAAVVIAASGMCQGGRIVDYLQALLPDERTDVIFAGYQAEGSLGRELQLGKHQVWVDGEPVTVNAQIHSMSGYSAHADQADLMRFVQGIAEKPKAIRLVHGEPEVQACLAEKLKLAGYACL